MKIMVPVHLFLLFVWSLSATAQQPLFLDPSAPIDDRVTDLVSRLTLEERVSQMVYNAPAIERLGIPAYNWWNECLHGVARAGIATVFPQAIGLAATWDTNLIFEVASTISTEARAKHHEFVRNGERGIYQGLTFWSPNINIFRDPRWGRGQETYGEDPYLTARMGVAFVKGLQGNDPRYLKVVATPKHFAVHSGPEPDRHHFDAYTSEQDLRETYLPAFEACVTEANAQSIMGAYNRFRGEACCASQKLLHDILRREWGFTGYVVSDCGAIRDIFADHKMVATPEEAAAIAVKAGCDLNCGNIYPHLIRAVQQGLISENEITLAVKRLFKARFLLGMFDPPEQVPFAQTPYELNDCSAHRQLALQTARESLVLLKNDQHVLPLSRKLKSIAVVGPNADDVPVLLGNYEGTPSAPVTILEGIQRKLAPETELIFRHGCDLVYPTIATLHPIPASALKPPAEFADQSGVRAEFFDNMDLAGEPVHILFNQNIDLNWKFKSPPPGMQPFHFSTRWRGILVPPITGNYELGVTSDDGFRLYLNDVLFLEDWTHHAPRTSRKSIWLEASREYPFQLDFYQNLGGALCQFGWLKPGDPELFFKAVDDEFQQTVAAAAKADVIIMIGGIHPQLEGEEMDVDAAGFKGGDRTTLDLPAIQEKLLQALHATGKPVVLVLLSGSALAVNWAKEHIPAIIQAWYPGGEGGTAVADVLFGDYNPAGRLPVTFYRSVDDLPPFEDYNMTNRTYRYFKGEPLYPFGYGLSYTRFKYQNLKIEPRKIQPDQNALVTIDVQNAGALAGDEVVQLYVSDRESSQPRPIKSLRGFQRIHLLPGEQRTVTFMLTPRDLSLYHETQGWLVEPGEFEIMVGGNSVTGLKNKLIVKP
ncbi:MAG: glycoside hydrolase family 3 C-terminal domain-containing protein [candidate division KSB1 bacterium]|nr:glycoside hydrolase family 3 C-terminal domain-containing protein [candidate division KSB1 bacterium]MDZ7317695.1 glycoside hydrolase family 3 C-terminal domain-containing protein [candidate division KSB1 bacterium]MDZ7340154.1 glycoside hydrolase family 3 C-terminal domain-containing protein [candidate division KSB1 bacterium]